MPVPTIKLVQNTITPPVEEYAAGDVLFNATPFALTLGLLVPIAALSHSVPGQFPLIIGLQNPAVDLDITIFPATQNLILTLNPAVSDVSVLPATQNLTLTLNPEDIEVDVPSASQNLVLTLNAPSLIIDSNEDAAGPQTLTLTLLAPTLFIDTNIILSTFTQPFNMILSGPNQLSPAIGYLGVTIKKYISDPIVKGGCAQCGTFLYESVRGRYVRGKVVKRGRNFDEDKGRREDQYVKCGRCGWTNHLNRAIHLAKDGSRAGWGLTYEEIEAGESDISYP